MLYTPQASKGGFARVGMQDSNAMSEEIARLSEAIVTIVGQEFERTQRVVLLSNLGQSLKKIGVDYRSVLAERKFAEFIRNDLADCVTLVPIPGKDKAIGIHPAGVDLGGQVNPFGSSPVTAQALAKAEPEQDKRPLINSQVWFAFSHFLKEGDTRILELQPTPVYRDLPRGEAVPEGAHRIEGEFIVPVGTMSKSERDARIYENITRWSADAGIPFDGLLAGKPNRAERRSLLDELIRALPTSDLSRVTLPLDLVKTLRDRRI